MSAKLTGLQEPYAPPPGLTPRPLLPAVHAVCGHHGVRPHSPSAVLSKLSSGSMTLAFHLGRQEGHLSMTHSLHVWSLHGEGCSA